MVHEPISGGDSTDERDDRRVLATDVDIADSLLSQTRGLMFRRSIPDDYALAFQFDSAEVRDVHMLFVFFSIDALWVADGVVQRVERLRPWLSFARAECDLLVELPAGAADGVESGDRVVLEEA
ncbi:DUF192 domain-containing protein [Haloterrigena alkaliphila]|nr:DUF192 domain-containing protein [Haloterrigena alkaliphila]QSW99428.2 DUF192 domain-containing protein [Haloterrigena alkaliphila]